MPPDAALHISPGPISCFKAYDVRGEVPEQLNEAVVYRIGRACAQFLATDTIVVGHDIRLSSPQLTTALKQGICAQGTDVLDIGLCGSEEVYFATANLNAGGGVMITASHNPANYNGLKFIREEARPISGDNGLFEIQRIAEAAIFAEPVKQGKITATNNTANYVAHLLSYIDPGKLQPLKIVVNAGNGGAGHVIDKLEPHLPFSFIKIMHAADGRFPNGVPNPLLPENREATSAAICESGAALGIAWDGDFDRCFFFDESGAFIEGYYIVGLLAEALLQDHPGQKIIHDPRLTWNTREIVTACGGIPVESKTGHAFIKARMRAEDAVYGGEMSAHHYFRDFAYCDSGMIPWLLITQLLSQQHKSLSELVAAAIIKYPVSGEINRKTPAPQQLLLKIENQYTDSACKIDHTDGLSMDFADWRFNLRSSNTEPVIRLNVETRGDKSLMIAKRDELLALIDEGV